MKTLLDLINRIPAPTPWQEGDNIPWDEPEFSQRMLDEHLSQEHDLASRRVSKIDEHVNWIHSELLGGQTTRILDLCCGPGLYTNRLAALGHECVGIDFSPASIAYAQEHAGDLSCRYIHEDVRRANFGTGFGLVLMLYGQINVFRRQEAREILVKARQALNDGGLLLLEPHTLDVVERMGTAPASWYSATKGLFSSEPHLVLQENFWHVSAKAATTRFFIIDASSGCVTRHAMTTQGYSNDEYESMLKESEFSDIQYFPSLSGKEDSKQKDLFVLTARSSK